MKKTTLFGCFAVTVAMIFSTGCAIEEPEKVVATYSGRSTGFGGDISVTISVGDKGNILKVESKGEKEIEYLEMVVCGLQSIQNGDSVRAMEEKLITHLNEKDRKAYYENSSSEVA